MLLLREKNGPLLFSTTPKQLNVFRKIPRFIVIVLYVFSNSKSNISKINYIVFVGGFLINCQLRFKEAETDCTTALQLDPEYVKAYHRRGLALKELNQLNEAQENFKKALDLEPKNTFVQKDLLKLEKKINESNSFKVI